MCICNFSGEYIIVDKLFILYNLKIERYTGEKSTGEFITTVRLSIL